MSLQPLAPTITTHLFPGVSQALISLLRQLPERDWQQATACPTWSVKDIVAHLLGGNLGRLSFQRDQLFRAGSVVPPNPDELTSWINQQNDTWVQATRRISAPVLLDFLELTDAQLHTFFMSLPTFAHTGLGVAWAGEDSSANWFDIGREYTEKWFHQQHIREAISMPGLLEHEWVRPVMEIGLRALPYTYRAVAAAHGTLLTIRIDGAGGGVWSLVREGSSWALCSDTRTDAQAQITMSTDTAWRLFSKGLQQHDIQRAIVLAGDPALGTPIWDLIAIMA